MMRRQIDLLEAMTLGEGASLPAFQPWLSWGLIAVVLFAGAGVYRRGSEIASLRNKIAALQAEEKAFQQQNGKTGSEGQGGSLIATAAQRTRWSPLMREVSLIIPEGVWTTRWETVPPDDRGRPGMRMTGGATSHDQVARFLTVLEHSVVASDPKLSYARRVNGEVQFEILLRLRAKGER